MEGLAEKSSQIGTSVTHFLPNRNPPRIKFRKFLSLWIIYTELSCGYCIIPHFVGNSTSAIDILLRGRCAARLLGSPLPDARAHESPPSYARRAFHFSGRSRITRSVSGRSEEHTSELQSLMRISYAVFCLKKKIHIDQSSTKQQSIHTIKHITYNRNHSINNNLVY